MQVHSMQPWCAHVYAKVGTPERPLSDLGRVSYHGYWTRELLMLLASHEGTISIKVRHPPSMPCQTTAGCCSAGRHALVGKYSLDTHEAARSLTVD